MSQVATEHCIPSVKVEVHKHWWTPDLDDLKQKCIDITDLWNSIGRPRSRPLMAQMLSV